MDAAAAHAALGISPLAELGVGMALTIRHYTETELDGVLSSWENTSTIAHPFLTEELLDEARDIHGDLEVEVFQAN